MLNIALLPGQIFPLRPSSHLHSAQLDGEESLKKSDDDLGETNLGTGRNARHMYK